MYSIIIIYNNLIHIQSLDYFFDMIQRYMYRILAHNDKRFKMTEHLKSIFINDFTNIGMNILD